MDRRRVVVLTAITCALLVSAAAEAGRLESDIAHRLNGSWGVLLSEGYSDCAGFYNNNEAGMGGVTSKAARRFDPGEVIKIDKINLKRSRLDLFLTLSEPVLMSRIEGPFELFDENECKLQLMIAVPRDLVKAKDLNGILDRVGELVELHGSASAALGSISANGREREDYPPDYEQTLARYEVWKAEMLNAAVGERIAAANMDARSVAVDIRRDSEYLDGFAAGVAEMRSWRVTDCDRLVDIVFSSVRERPTGDRGTIWKEGFSDGQELIFNLLLAERLQGCFVPVPPLP